MTKIFILSSMFLMTFCLSINAKEIHNLSKENWDLDSINYKVEIVKDSSKNSIKLYLSKNLRYIDSISINNVDVSFDSLTKLNGQWHFIYKIKDFYPTSSNKKNLKGSYNQIIIEVLNDRIHLAYAGCYHFSSQHEKNRPHGFFWKKDYRLNFNDSIGGPYVEFFKSTSKLYSEEKVIFDTINSVHYLKFDNHYHVYYSYKNKLNGEILVKSIDDEEILFFKNKEVFMLEIGDNVNIYLNGKWYRALNTNPITLREYNIKRH